MGEADVLQSNITLGGSTLMQREQPKDMHVNYKTFTRLRDRVKELGSFERSAAGLGWCCIGICASAALTLIPWTAAYSQLNGAAHLTYAFVTPMLAWGAVAAAAVAIVAFWERKSRRSDLRHNSNHIVEEMNEIVEPFENAARKAEVEAVLRAAAPSER